MKLAGKADRIAFNLHPLTRGGTRQMLIRDACDIATGGDLSCSLLDRLCDMVDRRLERMEQPLVDAGSIPIAPH